MEMIERVARAICLADGAEEDGIQLVPGETYRDYARAAIEAMREPTRHMAHVGGVTVQDETMATDGLSQHIACEAWREMIDAALNRDSTPKD